VIGDCWRAWRLIPGWKTHDGKRDIRWAEAVGFELLICTIASLLNTDGHVIVQGDNTVLGSDKSEGERCKQVIAEGEEGQLAEE
jgi:hypothetical protein